MSKKHTYEYIYNYFKEKDCKLLETEYINAQTKMQFECKCGNKSLIRFNDFKNSGGCRKCGIIKSNNSKRHTYEYIYNFFKENGCELLESEYKNTDTKMKYRCCCGNVSLIRFDTFKNGHRCYTCGIKKISINKKIDYDYVKNYIKENDYELLDKTCESAKTKINIKCNNNHTFLINFNHFQQGVRCRECYLETKWGKNNHKWNPNREEIKLNHRLRNAPKNNWIIKNMQHDQNYNNYLINSKEYHIDHIIPISIFSKFVLNYNLNEQLIKKIINKIENLQILPAKENWTKKDKGSIFEAAQYLMLNGIKLT
jgi:hypothetical protein